jgi:hypothetical protein
MVASHFLSDFFCLECCRMSFGIFMEKGVWVLMLEINMLNSFN